MDSIPVHISLLVREKKKKKFPKRDRSKLIEANFNKNKSDQ
nr:MAG TPA: hypothetical protein [Caudoviricetes sp.]